MSSRCRAAALRFLKIRPRSIFELREKLTGKKFEPQDIDEAIAYLQSIDLLNDRTFTASWIAYRLARPFGFRRIITELKAKGIAEEIIQESVTTAKGGYSEADAALGLGNRRAERLGGIDPQKRKKRVADYLLRRGFPMDVVMRVIKKV
jgi:regulatory protein